MLKPCWPIDHKSYESCFLFDDSYGWKGISRTPGHSWSIPTSEWTFGKCLAHMVVASSLQGPCRSDSSVGLPCILLSKSTLASSLPPRDCQVSSTLRERDLQDLRGLPGFRGLRGLPGFRGLRGLRDLACGACGTCGTCGPCGASTCGTCRTCETCRTCGAWLLGLAGPAGLRACGPSGACGTCGT